jgi:hypothetical protein
MGQGSSLEMRTSCGTGANWPRPLRQGIETAYIITDLDVE